MLSLAFHQTNSLRPDSSAYTHRGVSERVATQTSQATTPKGLERRYKRPAALSGAGGVPTALYGAVFVLLYATGDAYKDFV
jgi:hypothetical protein